MDAYYTMALFKRTMVNKNYAKVNVFSVQQEWPCKCSTHYMMPKIPPPEVRVNLFYRLQNVVNGTMEEKQQVKFFLSERKKNSVAWRKFLHLEKKKFEKGESSINGDKLKIFAFEKSVWD